jgi:hypothetical protein
LIAIRKDTEMQNYYRKHQGKKRKKKCLLAHGQKNFSVIKTETAYQIRNLVPIAIDRTIKITFLTSSTIQEK